MHEGVAYSVYDDGLGNPTIGIGFNLNRGDAPQILASLGLDYKGLRDGLKTLTKDDVTRLYEYTVKEAEKEVRKYIKNFDKLSEVRKRVLIDLMFNLGSHKFSQFKHFIDYVNQGRFNKASLNLSRSLWFRQTGYRGIRLVAMMLTDVDLIPKRT
jgi:lysozyme